MNPWTRFVQSAARTLRSAFSILPGARPFAEGRTSSSEPQAEPVAANQPTEKEPKDAGAREPWYKCPADEVDRNNPLKSEWGYLRWDGVTPVVDGDERPPDAEILASGAYLGLRGKNISSDALGGEHSAGVAGEKEGEC